MTDSFLENEVPSLLDGIKPDSQPLWGEMNATQMVDHIYSGLALSQDSTEWAMRTPEDKLPGAKAFLLSEKPLPRHAPLPEGFYKREFGTSSSLEAAKERFLEEVPVFLEALDKPDYVAYHPDFGKMSNVEILTLMRKHVRHHLAQFGVIER